MPDKLTYMSYQKIGVNLLGWRSGTKWNSVVDIRGEESEESSVGVKGIIIWDPGGIIIWRTRIDVDRRLFGWGMSPSALCRRGWRRSRELLRRTELGLLTRPYRLYRIWIVCLFVCVSHLLSWNWMVDEFSASFVFIGRTTVDPELFSSSWFVWQELSVTVLVTWD